MQTVPQSDAALADLVAWLGRYRLQYNLDLSNPADQGLTFVMDFDGLPRKVVASSSEPLAPEVGDLWCKGAFMYECASLTPVRPLAATWDLIQDHASLWTATVTQLSPTYVPTGMGSIPAGTVPRQEGTIMKNRLFLAGPAASALEAVPLMQINAVQAELTELDRKVREIQGQAQLPTVVRRLEVENDPVQSLDAVNLRWAQAQISEIHSWVEEIRHAVNTRPEVDFTSMEEQVTAIRQAMLKVQDVTNLMRTTGGRFGAKVYIPYDPSKPPTDDDEAVAWGFVKGLRESVGEIRCVDGSEVVIDPAIDPDGDLEIEVEIKPDPKLTVIATLYEVGEDLEPFGNPVPSIPLNTLINKVYQLQLEVSSTMSVAQPLLPPLTDPNWEYVRPWDVAFPTVQPMGTVVIVCQIRWIGPLPNDNTRSRMNFRRGTPDLPFQLPIFI